MVRIYILIFLSTLGIATAQPLQKFTSSDLHNYKVDHHKYDLWWENDFWTASGYRWALSADTIPSFVDITDYKGILNYGVSFESKDFRNFFYFENYTIYHLNIEVTHFTFNPADSIATIHGTIRGGWPRYDNPVNGFPTVNKQDDAVEIITGIRRPSTTFVKFQPLTVENAISIYEGKQITIPVVLDTLPSFQLDNSLSWKSTSGEVRTFNISTKINRNSILAFGLQFCYAEIFEIGELVFAPPLKQKRKPQKRPTKAQNYTDIVLNNIQMSAPVPEKPELSFYYSTTTKAEDFIMGGRFANANLEYQKLLKDSSNIFARDISNAVRCAVIARDYQTAGLWCEKLALKGIGINYFNAKIFNGFRKSQQWKEFTTRFPRIHQQYQNGLDTTLIKQIRQLAARDQIDYEKNSRGEISKSDLQKTTDSLSGEFIKLIGNHGFPTEEKIGLRMLNDTVIESATDYSVLLYHNVQMRNSNRQELERLVAESAAKFEYDNVRDGRETVTSINCLHIYKGKLYSLKSCRMNGSEAVVKRLAFKFRNKQGFIIDTGKFLTIAHNPSGSESDDADFVKDFDFLLKLTD